MTAVAAPLHTVQLGEKGSPLVFCHGLFGQGRNWTQIGKQFAQDHRVLLVDLPNHGQSPWTEQVDLVEDADRLADQLRPLGPVALVGHSMGGKVAMLTALRHPEVVERLVVVDISPVTYRHLGEFSGYIDAMKAIDLGQLERRDQADAALQEAVPSRGVRGFLLQNLRRDADGRWAWVANLDALRKHLADIGGWPDEWTEGVEPYEGPVLWIAGADSHYVKEEYAPAMEALFPRVRRVTIKNAGHWVHSERPDVFVEVLERFVS
ncbi:alpha/beta fold hydrolase [Nocardioides jishulii]|uniref:Alpha/beta fold hydrolase n=1 Tax=Nocardioides jishulii TaxID=2575440 RepID=A0A4U2YHZ3_9ACTN|nr:alpha/beta fold hydrolase [Nocardioides jishulii]QCX28032.1 alpha/beta fold hydrolase [Nocardioides jishulii]TKI60696.1 alpha/beta fold hydrolase [Nocardioides jishulii]